VAVSVLEAPRRLFVLPAGTACPPLTAAERTALGPNAELEAIAAESLMTLGAADADAVVVPSPSSQAALERDAALAARASDQPIVAVRLGCDEPPFDPASDATLAAPYSPESAGGKALCRRALARRASLALGPRTLLLVTAPLSGATEGKAVLEALARLARLDVAIAVPAGGDRTLTDRAAVLAIEHPGKVAVVSDAMTGGDRALLAGADALLLADPDDHTARPAGFALRYGTLPIAPEGGANADYVVDHDPVSGTGCALLYSNIDPFQIEGAVRRAVALRANAEVWQALVPSLMLAAPRWSATVTALDGIEPPVAAALAASA
jgi:starch synthase